jgi:hypothetical protein
MTSQLRPALLVLLLACLWRPAPVSAEVRRCETASGAVIFTDRKCTDVNATERVPHAGAAAARVYRGGCARNLQDLVFEITTAIDAQDANRLAGVYHWPGMSGTTAYQVWSRLDAIARRPLVDIVPVMPSTPSPPAPALPAVTGAGTTTADAAHDGLTPTQVYAAPAPAPDPQLYPQTSVRRTPVALRVEQTLGTSATPSRTVFGLVRHFGCWWVRL